MRSMILKNYQLDYFNERHDVNCDFVILSIDTDFKVAQAILEADLKMQIDFMEAMIYL